MIEVNKLGVSHNVIWTDLNYWAIPSPLWFPLQFSVSFFLIKDLKAQ